MAPAEGTLLLNLTRMGDLIQSTPLAVGLSRRKESGPVVACVDRAFLPAARLMDGVDEIVPIDLYGIAETLRRPGTGWAGTIRAAEESLAPLLTRRFRMAINLTHTDTSAILMYLVDAPDRRGIQISPDGHRIVRHPWMMFFLNYAINKQFTPFNLVDLYSLGGDVPVHRDPIPLSLRVPPEADRKAAERLLPLAGGSGPVVAIQAGASDPHKMWHPSSFVRVCRSLRDAVGARFLFLGGPGERELAARIRELSDSPGSLLLAGETSLDELAAILKRADLMITNDTGPMHLAAAVGTPVISLAIGPVYYSNTSPYGEGHIVFQPVPPCAPCSFAVRCTDPACKNMVSADAVASVAVRRLRGEEIPPRSIPDGPLFAGCEVYRSVRGEDGLLDYLPLLDRPQTRVGRIQRAYRGVWVDSLLGRAGIPGGTVPVPAEAERQVPGILRLERAAEQGRRAAGEILRLARASGRYADRIRAAGETVRECSRRIRELGLACPEINGLCRMFAFQEENMGQGPLVEAARETRSIFRDLLERTRSLAGRVTEEVEPCWKDIGKEGTG
ncbi:MAG: glycosyltransferase family 9 protein [Deltaproteobacteria bacterium]